MRDREWRHITNEAANEVANDVGIIQAPVSIGEAVSLRDAFESITQQLYGDPFDNVVNDGYYPGDEYREEITWGDDPRLMIDIDSSGHLGATPEHEGTGEYFRVMIRNNRYIPQWKNRWDDVWNYFPDDDDLGIPRNYPTYGSACDFIRHFSHINATEIPLTSIIGREELPDEKIYLYYR